MKKPWMKKVTVQSKYFAWATINKSGLVSEFDSFEIDFLTDLFSNL